MISIKSKNETKTNEKPKWLTPTSINDYFHCPRKFFNKRHIKIKSKPSLALIRGCAVDSAIESFYTNNLNKKCADYEYGDLRQIVLDLFKIEWADREESLLELELKADNAFSGDLEFFYEQSKNMMLNWLHHFIADKGFYKYPGPLVQKNLYSKDYLIRGRADLIDRSTHPPVIIDWKTNQSMEITPAIHRQMGLYALIYETVFKVRPDVAVHFVRYKEGYKQYKISDQEMDDLKKLVFDIHRKTQSKDPKDYPCRCGWCKTDFGQDDSNKVDVKT